jgi:plastocyanin
MFRWVHAVALGVALAVLAGVPVEALGAGLLLKAADGKGAPLEDMVVTVTPVGAALPDGTALPEAVMGQKDKAFLPHVLVVRTGTVVRFPNEDDIKHNVYSFSPAKPFQLHLYGGEEVKTVLFDKAGVVVLGCNIHDQMLGYIFVTDSPFFMKSGPDGSARLDGLPAGRYRLHVWHPRMLHEDAEPDREIALAEGDVKTLSLSLAVKADRRMHGMMDDGYGY